MSMLFITHDLGIVRKVADRVCVMTKGKIVETGPTNGDLRQPAARLHEAPARRRAEGQAAGIDDDRQDGDVGQRRQGLVPDQARASSARTVDHVKAVDGIDVTVRAGQTLGVVGESGSGKTTLGLALAAHDLVQGPDQLPRRRHQQAVLQRDAAAARASCRSSSRTPTARSARACRSSEIIEEGLEDPRAVALADERDERVVGGAQARSASIPRHRIRYPHEFSGGQRQRIAIARAMVLKPKFVMLDEPTSALDMSVQAQVVDLLRDLQAKHDLAYLFISHDLKVIRALANDVIVMRNGKIVEHGPTQQIFERPQSGLYQGADLGGLADRDGSGTASSASKSRDRQDRTEAMATAKGPRPACHDRVQPEALVRAAFGRARGRRWSRTAPDPTHHLRRGVEAAAEPAVEAAQSARDLLDRRRRRPHLQRSPACPRCRSCASSPRT